MATEYKLSYTGREINEKLGKIDKNSNLITELQDDVDENKVAIEVERSRINQFVALEEGSTTGDAELQDIRVSYYGKTYSSAGDAVRGQVEVLNRNLNDLRGDIESQLPFNTNVLKDYSWEFGYMNTSTLKANGNKGYMMTTERIPVVGGSKIVVPELTDEVVRITVYTFIGEVYKETITILDYYAGFIRTDGLILADDVTSIHVGAKFSKDMVELPTYKPILYINPASFEEVINEVKEDVKRDVEEVKNEVSIVEERLNSITKRDITKSYFYYHVTEQNVSSYFNFRYIANACSGATFVDWGDGTSTEITVGDDELKHFYTSAGDYVITVDGLTALGDRAFRSKTGLYKAILANTIESIGNHAFTENAEDFSSIEFTSENPPTLGICAVYEAKEIYVPEGCLLKYVTAWENILINEIDNQEDYVLYRVKTNSENSIIHSKTVITVGNGGNYETIKEALLYFSSKYPIYKKGGVPCEIKITAGTTITEQIYVERIDLQYITITSEDNIVPVNCDGWVATADFHDSRADYPFIAGENGAGLPTIGTVFQLVTNTNNIQTVGYLANRGSNGVVLSNSGFDSFYDGVIANNESSVTIREGISRNMTRWGIHSRHNGEISARSIIATNCGISAYADRVADLDVREADLSGSTVAIYGEHTSRINANGCHANNCGSDTDWVVKSGNGSVVNCSGLEVTNAVGNIFEIHEGGTLIAFSLNTTGLVSGKTVFNQNTNTVSNKGIIYG